MTKDWNSISLGQPKEYTKLGVILINNWSITNITMFGGRRTEGGSHKLRRIKCIKKVVTREKWKKSVHLWLPLCDSTVIDICTRDNNNRHLVRYFF